jgi:aryl-alcohol dehydrogenase
VVCPVGLTADMPKHIRAAVLRRAGGPFSVEDDVVLDDPRPGEVLVRIVGAGVCHTEAIVRDQWYPVPLPVVLGHEGAGIVEAIGQGVEKVRPGDKVVLSFDSCGRCRACLGGRPSYCDEAFERSFGATRQDGSTAITVAGEPVHSHFFGQSSFGTYAIATERSVVRVETDVPVVSLGPLGCGIQTGAGAVINALRCAPGTGIAVFGTGAVGLSAVMAAKTVGVTTIVGVDPVDTRRHQALELGATHTVEPQDDLVERIRGLSGGGVDYALDTTGNPAVVRNAVDVLATGGVCGIIGASRLGSELVLDMNQVFFGRTVRGIIEGDSVPDILIPKLIRLHEAGLFPFDRLLQFYALDEINEAIADSEQGRVVKPVLRMSRVEAN